MKLYGFTILLLIGHALLGQAVPVVVRGPVMMASVQLSNYRFKAGRMGCD